MIIGYTESDRKKRTTDELFCFSFMSLLSLRMSLGLDLRTGLGLLNMSLHGVIVMSVNRL
jgi:hypothetical protein